MSDFVSRIFCLGFLAGWVLVFWSWLARSWKKKKANYGRGGTYDGLLLKATPAPMPMATAATTMRMPPSMTKRKTFFRRPHIVPCRPRGIFPFSASPSSGSLVGSCAAGRERLDHMASCFPFRSLPVVAGESVSWPRS